MSAGQRTVIARNDAQDVKKRFDQNYENPHLHSDEQQQQFSDYEEEGDYEMVEDDDEGAFVTTAKSHKRIRGKFKNDKRHKSKASSSTIGAKLQNLQLIRSSM